MAQTSEAPPLAGGAADHGAAVPAEQPRELAALTGQLREKDQLVAALTERLEQAAEQLDRLRRTGADKGRRPITVAGAAAGPEWLSEHKATFDDLKRVLGNWDEVQPGAAFTRIETQLAQLSELLSSGAAVSAPVRASGTSERAAPATAAATPAPAAPKPAGHAPTNTWWEAQKAALMGGESLPAEGSTEPSAAASTGTQGIATGDTSDEPQTQAASGRCWSEFVVPEAPPPVDFESLTMEDARQAIRDRDAVIQQLREPLLLAQAAGELPSDFGALEQLPETLQKRIADIEAQWQAKFRQNELELSLERARLAREQSQLRHQQELLQKQSRNQGEGTREAAPDEDKEESNSRRRWFRFMGKSGDAEKDADPSA